MNQTLVLHRLSAFQRVAILIACALRLLHVFVELISLSETKKINIHR